MPRPSPETSTAKVPYIYRSGNGFVNSGTRTVTASTRTYTSVNSPQYYKYSKIPHGLPDNNHEMKLTTRTEFPVSRYGQKYTPLPILSTDWDSYIDLFQNMVGLYTDRSYNLSHSAQAYERAKQNCIDRVKNMDINVGQSIAELQRTMDLVGDTAMTIAKSIRAFKRGKISQGFKLLGIRKPKGIVPSKKAADDWLAVQYGWLPLLDDVKGAAEALAKKQFPPVFKFKGRSSASDSAQIHTQAIGYGITFKESGYRSDAEVMMAFCMNNYTSRTLNELGITDPLSIVWELVPWSFVVDWFIPIGKYLQSVDYTDGLTFKTGYIVQFSSNSWTAIAGSGTYNSGGVRYNFIGGPIVSSKNVWLSRTKLQGPLAVSLPQLKNPVNPAHMMNGLALLSSSFR
jgi:hypothetical protein